MLLVFLNALSSYLHVRKYGHPAGSYISQFPSSTRFANVTKRRNYFLSLSFQKLHDAVTGVGRDASGVSPVFHRSREKKSGLEKYRFIILFIELLLPRRKMLPCTISEIIEIIIQKSKEKLKKNSRRRSWFAFYFSLSATCAYPSLVLIPCACPP